MALPLGAEMTNRVGDFMTSVHERQQLGVDRMRLRRQATVEELRLENDSIREELRDDTDRRRAEAVMEREALKTRYDERLHTQLGVEVSQQFQIGQLQVDEKQLKDVLIKREKDHEALMESYTLLEKDRKQRLTQQNLRLARQALENGDTKQAQAYMAQTACGQVPIPPDCAKPLQEKLMAQEALTQPIKQPLLPTEIPLVIPVTLKMELGGPAMSNLQVKRTPRPPNEALKQCKPECCKTCERVECTCEAPSRKPCPAPAWSLE